MEDIGNAVLEKIEHRMNIIAYTEWRKHRSNVHRALTALVDMGTTFSLITVLIVAGVNLTAPIDSFVQKEIAGLVEQGVIQCEITGLWWDSYKAVV